jgi:glycopeptide antibiotics resistance protein
MLRPLLYPFLVYRSFFFPFFVVSAIAVPCWLLFRLYRHRIAGTRTSFRRELLLLIVVFYLSGLASATLTPNHPSRAEPTVEIELRPSLASLTCSTASLPEGSNARFFCKHNAAGNVLLFLPLGILLPFVLGRLRFRSAVGIAIALSVGIELLQLLSRTWGSYRHADINDVILNAIGACLGLVLAALLRWRPGVRSALPQA